MNNYRFKDKQRLNINLRIKWLSIIQCRIMLLDLSKDKIMITDDNKFQQKKILKNLMNYILKRMNKIKLKMSPNKPGTNTEKQYLIIHISIS